MSYVLQPGMAGIAGRNQEYLVRSGFFLLGLRLAFKGHSLYGRTLYTPLSQKHFLIETNPSK